MCDVPCVASLSTGTLTDRSRVNEPAHHRVTAPRGVPAGLGAAIDCSEPDAGTPAVSLGRRARATGSYSDSGQANGRTPG